MYFGKPGSRRGRASNGARLLIALIIAMVSVVAYCNSNRENPITGEKQRVAMTTQEEIALGLNAAPQMIDQFGGLHPDPAAQARVDQIGERLLAALNQSLAADGRQNPYPFEFYLLGDTRTVNAFALPGGQVFLTAALYERLTTDGQVAGVLGHEMGHVIQRHGAQQLAKQRLTQGIGGAVGVASGDIDAARMAQVVGAMINMQYGRDAEKESDREGVQLSAAAGYDPRAMIEVMRVLEGASGGGGPPEFLSTHPKPANRIAYIQKVLREAFPQGVPEGLEP